LKIIFIFVVALNLLNGHNPDKELPRWKHYSRIGFIRSGDNIKGLATYLRFKRTTSYTFRDLRFYGHFFNNNQEIRLRQKTSRRFMNFDWIYSFNTLFYERNTFLNVDLRYHYNQGLGWLIRNTDVGNSTIEIGLAFDNSDYLQNNQKTSYVKNGFTFDQNISMFSIKTECNYFHQFNKNIDGSDQSRVQILGEFEWELKRWISIIGGIKHDLYLKKLFSLDQTFYFLSLEFNKALLWNI
tara:strand:+ start:2847 stop:3566 length:720 start_codon:yes stop_codon:yes gene_type:complete